MKKQELQTAIKKLKKGINKKSTMPILDNVLNVNGTLTVSSLNVFLTINTGFDGVFLFDFKQLDKILAKLPANAEIEIGVNGEKVELTTGSGAKFSFPASDPADFPKPKDCKKEIGHLNIDQIGTIKKAVKFVSNDSLRPVMQCVFIGDHIAASDAHRLVYFQYEKTLSEEIMILKEVAEMINFNDYKVFVSEDGARNIKLTNEKETIVFRETDGKYVNYQSVIPEKCPIEITLNTKDVIETVKMALVTANAATKKVKFDFDGDQVLISSEDLDFESTFSQKITVKEQNENSGINIGVNGEFLLSLLDDCGNTVTFRMTDASRAILLDDNKLLMPVML